MIHKTDTTADVLEKVPLYYDNADNENNDKEVDEGKIMIKVVMVMIMMKIRKKIMIKAMTIMMSIEEFSDSFNFFSSQTQMGR